MTKKKYIVWDWNGTLLNDVDLCVESINYLLAKERLPILPDKDAYQRVFKFPIIDYYKDAGFDFEKRPFPQLADDYMQYYQPRSLSCSLHEGVHDTLKTCASLGYTQVLLSASKIDLLLEQLEGYSITPYFEEVLALDNIHAYSKAALAKNFTKRIAYEKESILFLGDSVHDYEVANGAGAECVLIANGHEHKEKLEQTGCRVLNTIQEFKELLVL